MRMCQEADLIRNKTLQELFVLRRHLELSQINSSENIFVQSSLNYIQEIHHSLKKLSEYLYPAHIDDSLSLAIRSILESWKLHFSVLNFHLELPEVLEKESEEHSRIILMIIEELLQITLSRTSNASIFIKLEEQIHFSQLEIQIIDIANLSHIIHSYHLSELDFLCRIFNFFTGGKCSYHQNNNTQKWCFYWQKNQLTKAN